MLEGRNETRESLAQSKLEIGKYVEKYGKYFLIRWRELGNQPALQFYNRQLQQPRNQRLLGRRKSGLLICGMSRTFFQVFLTSALLCLVGSGCSFKMGSPISGGAHLHIRVKNDSLAPLLGAKVDRDLRKTMLRNGSFILVSNREEADVFLTVTLKATVILLKHTARVTHCWLPVLTSRLLHRFNWMKLMGKAFIKTA